MEMHSVANLATLLLDLATFQTPLATFFFLSKKRLATNLKGLPKPYLVSETASIYVHARVY